MGAGPALNFADSVQTCGCPTFRDFRKVGTTDPAPVFIHHRLQPGSYVTPSLFPTGSIAITARDILIS